MHNVAKTLSVGLRNSPDEDRSNSGSLKSILVNFPQILANFPKMLPILAHFWGGSTMLGEARLSVFPLGFPKTQEGRLSVQQYRLVVNG